MRGALRASASKTALPEGAIVVCPSTMESSILAVVKKLPALYPLSLINLPVTVSKAAKLLSTADAGPTTSPVPTPPLGVAFSKVVKPVFLINWLVPEMSKADRLVKASIS